MRSVRILCLLMLIVGWHVMADVGSYKVGEKHMKEVLERAEKIAKQREEVEAELIRIVKMKTKDAKLWRLQKKAVELLGRIGTERCVDTLIDVLEHYFDKSKPVMWIEGGGWTEPTPAMKALVELGPLAVEKLVDAYLRDHEERWITLKQALSMLHCYRLVAGTVIYRAKEAVYGERGKEKMTPLQLKGLSYLYSFMVFGRFREEELEKKLRKLAGKDKGKKAKR